MRHQAYPSHAFFPRTSRLGAAAVLFGAALLSVVVATTPGHAQQSARTPAPPQAQVYFIDLKDGSRVPLNLHVRLGLQNMGVSPAGVAFPGTGHHHILIDAPLPPLDRPIPADDNHLHLGGGQTEADLTLTPGPHTLQLLMGDKDHVPHEPPVMSAVIHVVAVAPRTPSPRGASAALIGLQEGQRIAADTTVYFGLHGMGVAPASDDHANTGHHHLLIDTAPPGDLDAALPNDDQHRSFPDGATQTDLTLPPGRHTLQLVFTDRQDRQFDPPIMSKPITVNVRGARRTP